MLIRAVRFNIYLLLALGALLAGCKTSDGKRKQPAALRIHLEVPPDRTGLNEQVAICRSSPVMVTVSKSPIINENEIQMVKLVENPGGFALHVQFDRRGTWLLEQYTGANPGRRLAIFCLFGDETTQGRWLAAPMISRRISDGVLVFTPDADRSEAEQIERGLNEFARKTQPKADKQK